MTRVRRTASRPTNPMPNPLLPESDAEFLEGLVQNDYMIDGHVLPTGVRLRGLSRRVVAPRMRVQVTLDNGNGQGAYGLGYTLKEAAVNAKAQWREAFGNPPNLARVKRAAILFNPTDRASGWSEAQHVLPAVALALARDLPYKVDS